MRVLYGTHCELKSLYHGVVYALKRIWKLPLNVRASLTYSLGFEYPIERKTNHVFRFFVFFPVSNNVRQEAIISPLGHYSCRSKN